ncbi:nucleoside-diphosphate sugar epimerase [Bifidobacterium pseudolongum PV8-2]|uniref:Nucleoside-diphosphate sugar epimerase n=1 Tax=Bifidobacterium pseudolongum PV8-2 TaxID=1447715 RepID=A0A0A7I9N6_9BIFI|nr:NAD(P)-dependent oxidoreductase [Bifidobacterium pseudolongum]AIZ16786.1 nucleoside-diphosphate sugar epimerase [Bifidobacterium pseudolongum PV8-2]
MIRIMVTGADGYIGKGVVEKLLDDGQEVIAMGLNPCGLENDHLTEYVGDIFEFDFSHLKSTPDAVLHLAWRNGFAHNNISNLEDLPKHYQFIERALEAGVKRIAIMGTMHEVGYHEGAVNENTPCNPVTPYAVAKNALRQLTEALCKKHKATWQWLRGYYIVSNDGRGDSIFAKLVAAVRGGEKSFPFTSGKNKYDFLPYDEFCRLVVAAVEQDAVSGIINICSGKPVSLGEYIEGFIAENKLPVTLEYGRFPDRSYDSPVIYGDSSKIREIMRNVE